MSKTCNGCKRHLENILFMRKDKEHARCNDCSCKSSCKKNICKVCGIKAYYNYENISFTESCFLLNTCLIVFLATPLNL